MTFEFESMRENFIWFQMSRQEADIGAFTFCTFSL